MTRVLLLLLLLLVAAPVRAAEPFDPFRQATIEDRPDARAPMGADFTDEAGRRADLKAIAGGRPLVVAFVQHRCPNLCGASLQGLAQAAQGQGGFSIVALSLDPKEGPTEAQTSVAHLARSGVVAHGLTGAPADIAAVTSSLGYRYAWDPRLQQYAHIAAAAVLAPDGRLAGWVYGVAPPPQVLKTALAAAAKGTVAGVADRLLLLCYHYDADKGRYDPLAWTLLRSASIAAVVVVAGLIGWAVWREKRA